MEYSVKDLVKILLKKWWLIILIVGITVAVSYFMSDRSYKQASADYKTYTTAVQQVQKKTGTLTAAYSIRAKTESDSFIQAYTNFLVHHNFSESDTTPTMEEIAEFALQSLEPHMEALLLNKDILAAADIEAAEISYTNQTNITTPGTASPPPAKPIEIRYLGSGRFYVTMTSVVEADAQLVLQNYIKELTQTLSSPTLEYQVDKISYVYNADKPILTDSALLAQLVMTDPSQSNAQARMQTTYILKQLCIAAVFSFAISCVLILIVTFVKDSAAAEKKLAQAQSPEGPEHSDNA